jgi:diguanylate cyclase (GGDEF)-like protein
MPIDERVAVHRHRGGLHLVRGWALWSIPRSACLYMLVIEALAAAGTITLLVTRGESQTDLVRVSVLAILAIGYAEGTARIERLKRYMCSGRVFSNEVSVWICAGLLTVSAAWAAVLVVIIYGHLLVQRRHDKSNNPYRVAFTAAAAVLAVLAGKAILSAAGGTDAMRGGILGPVVAVGAVLTYSLGSLLVVMAGMWLTLRPPSVRAMLPDTDTIVYEVATLGLGILAAELIVHTLVLTPIIIGLAICLHRSSLVSGLDRSSRTDTKTGLLNNTAWNEHATGVLSRSQRDRQPVTVLFLDLDHFKAVNDTHGHLVGDRVLVAVADCLRRELRGHDGLGRYGGEEFVVILDRLTLPEAQLVADRLRNAVLALRVHNGLQVTVSIGLTHEQLHHGTDLQQLLARADSALYQAKGLGRNRVHAA